MPAVSTKLADQWQRYSRAGSEAPLAPKGPVGNAQGQDSRAGARLCCLPYTHRKRLANWLISSSSMRRAVGRVYAEANDRSTVVCTGNPDRPKPTRGRKGRDLLLDY